MHIYDNISRNSSQTKAVQKITKHISCAIIFLSDNRAVYVIMRKNMMEPNRRHDSIIRRTRIAFWIARVTDTHSEYVILLIDGNNGYTNASQDYVYTYLDCVVCTAILGRTFQYILLEI
jgi:hypothetical protein